MFIIWENFTKEWIKRSRRKWKLDDGDKFISLWIAFNGWMRATYCEIPVSQNHELPQKEIHKMKQDRYQLNCVKVDSRLESTFNSLKDRKNSFSKRLQELRSYEVLDMRDIVNYQATTCYDGAFPSLIEVLYSVRCNLFHGRKNTEQNTRDLKLVTLSYHILYALFINYLKDNDSSYFPYKL
jgi:hypothetical protein